MYAEQRTQVSESICHTVALSKGVWEPEMRRCAHGATINPSIMKAAEVG